MAIILNRRSFFQNSALLAALALVFAQPPQPAAGQDASRFIVRPELIARPEVQPDHKITFHLKAPKASAVQLLWMQKTQPMVEDKDGIWSVTVDPVEPEIYNYSFMEDGVSVGASTVEVPGTPPRIDERQNVPHGSVNIHTYFATAQNRQRGLCVYVPPQYYTEINRKFPVLYLWSGGRQEHAESEWTSSGRANVMLDNLIAQHRAVPMIIVMPNNDAEIALEAGDMTSLGRAAVIEKELLADIIAFVEKNYRTLNDRNSRAMAGLSWGAGTTFIVGMRHLDMFGYLGEFGTGVFGGSPPVPSAGIYGPYEPEKIAPGIYQNLVSPAKKLKVFYMSVGTEDPRYPYQKSALADFQKHGIEPVFKPFAGGHEWKVWRHSLADFAPMLFK